ISDPNSNRILTGSTVEQNGGYASGESLLTVFSALGVTTACNAEARIQGFGLSGNPVATSAGADFPQADCGPWLITKASGLAGIELQVGGTELGEVSFTSATFYANSTE